MLSPARPGFAVREAALLARKLVATGHVHRPGRRAAARRPRLPPRAPGALVPRPWAIGVAEASSSPDSFRQEREAFHGNQLEMPRKPEAVMESPGAAEMLAAHLPVDLDEHAHPVELTPLGHPVEGISEAKIRSPAPRRSATPETARRETSTGANMSALGERPSRRSSDVAPLLSVLRQGQRGDLPGGFHRRTARPPG